MSFGNRCYYWKYLHVMGHITAIVSDNMYKLKHKIVHFLGIATAWLFYHDDDYGKCWYVGVKA